MAANASPPRDPNEEEFLTVSRILVILLARKWTLLGGTFLIGLVLAGLTLRMNNSYESVAALVIREPQIPIAGEAAPLAIEMLQSLTESIDVKKTLYDRLRDERILQPDLKFAVFQRTLKTIVDRRARLAQAGLLPMIHLQAREENPELAMRVANMWADIVTSRSKEIYTHGVGELSDFIKGVSEEADKNLSAREDAYTSKILAANLAVEKATLAGDLAMHSRLYGEYLRICDDYETTRSVWLALRQALRAMETTGGEWIGNTLWQAHREGKPIPEGLTTTSLRLSRTIEEIIRNEQALASLEKGTQLQFLEMELKAKEAQLQDVSKGIVDARNALAKLEKQHEILQQQLAAIPEKNRLTKAITDDVLFEAHLKGEMKEGDKTPYLQTEEMNLVYLTVKQAVVQMGGEIEGMRKRAEYYQETRDQLKQEVTDLAGNLETLRARKAVMETARQDNLNLFKHMGLQYQKARNEHETLLPQLEKLWAKKTAKETELVGLKTSIQKLERSVFTDEQKLDALKRKVEDVRQVRTSLSAKAQEIALLTISATQASRSGTTVLFRAAANPLKVAPKRSRIVLAGMFAAFLLLSFLFVAREMIQRERSHGA